MVAKPLCPLYKYMIKPLDRAYYPELRYHYILRQLLILFSIAYPITYERLSYYLQQPAILAGISYPICHRVALGGKAPINKKA